MASCSLAWLLLSTYFLVIYLIADNTFKGNDDILFSFFLDAVRTGSYHSPEPTNKFYITVKG